MSSSHDQHWGTVDDDLTYVHTDRECREKQPIR
jgi:hypothetical protein